MLETGVLISKSNEPIYWHLPSGRSSGYLPDTPELWSVIWDNRENVLGFAHTHPGTGIPGPSYEDVTTFAAIEAGLGKRLIWWISSDNELIKLEHGGKDKLSYNSELITLDVKWLEDLRSKSYGQH